MIRVLAHKTVTTLGIEEAEDRVECWMNALLLVAVLMLLRIAWVMNVVVVIATVGYPAYVVLEQRREEGSHLVNFWILSSAFVVMDALPGLTLLIPGFQTMRLLILVAAFQSPLMTSMSRSLMHSHLRQQRHG